MKLFDAILYGVATWRLARMIASEEGPAGVFHTLQDYAVGREDWVGRGLLCPDCLSVWIGIWFTLTHLVDRQVARAAALPWAISALTVWLERRLS